MNRKPDLIVMLTHNDITVKNAYEIFEQCKNSKAKYWGFKEVGLSLDEMKRLFNFIKKCGKMTVLEVVAYTEETCLDGAKIAKECNCDYLIGTFYYDSINDFCKENNIKYMPFIGKVKGRPSILEGTINDMIKEANSYLKKGVYGVNLLGYRYTENPTRLNKEIVSNVKPPVCIAGSINSFERLDEVKDANPMFFTIGGAFFENKFNGNFCEQINNVCDYINGIYPINSKIKDGKNV